MDHSPRAAIRQVTHSLPQSSLTRWVSAVSPTSDQPSSGSHHSGPLSGRYSPSDRWQRLDVPIGPTSIRRTFRREGRQNKEGASWRPLRATRVSDDPAPRRTASGRAREGCLSCAPKPRMELSVLAVRVRATCPCTRSDQCVCIDCRCGEGSLPQSQPASCRPDPSVSVAPALALRHRVPR
jgi:hypothetical protein